MATTATIKTNINGLADDCWFASTIAGAGSEYAFSALSIFAKTSVLYLRPDLPIQKIEGFPGGAENVSYLGIIVFKIWSFQFGRLFAKSNFLLFLHYI